MLVPLSWINEYVDPSEDLSELVAKLNASGTSVEHVFSIGQGLDDLVVGQVLEVYPHPQADRLRLAKVEAGQGPVEVVCGAHNLAADQHIVFAKPGSRIPVDMHDPERKSFVLQTATIRGVVSNGMICSVAEMGLGEDHDGILVLDTDAKPGTPINQVLNYPQIVLDLEITSNRSDELSVIGIAREIATLTNQTLHAPQPNLSNVQVDNSVPIFEPIIQSPDCYRLITRSLSVKVGPSPYWLQQRLQLAGMRSINNVVDITNYVMLETGQPLHAYDAHKLHGSQLIARPAQAGESMTTLDGQERPLQEGILLITDQERILGIAGIMGGQDSGTTEDTTNIVLEAAAFNPVAIRKTANTISLRSEASKRFERTVDRENTDLAIDRAVELLLELASTTEIGPKKQAYPQPQEARQLNLGSKKLFQYLGQRIDPLQVREILKSLGFGDASAFGKDDDWQIAVWVPSWRLHDIQQEEDLIEEVVRILGYDQLPVELPAGQPTGLSLNQRWRNQVAIRHSLAQAGWMETMSISLVGQELYQKAHSPLPSVRLSNPLSSEWTHMRDQLLPSLAEVVAKNHYRHKSDQALRLFELSSVYLGADEGLPNQHLHLGLAIHQADQAEQAVAQTKGVIQQALQQVGIQAQQIQYQPANQPLGLLSPGYLEIKVDDYTVGHLGNLSLAACLAFDIPKHLVLAELNLEPFLEQKPINQFAPPSRFPGIEEDISLLVPESESLGLILDIIKQAGQPLLEQAQVSSIYRHSSLGPNKKSPLIHLVFRHPDQTLTNQEVAPVREAIINALAEQGITPRG